MERNFERRSFAPIRVGEELDVKIEAEGSKGDGIAKVKGFVIFIPGAKPGENIKIRITKVFRKVGFAEVVGPGNASSEQTETTESTTNTEEESYEDSEGEEEIEDESPKEE